jgi:hypothetical protein
MTADFKLFSLKRHLQLNELHIDQWHKSSKRRQPQQKIIIHSHCTHLERQPAAQPKTAAQHGCCCPATALPAWKFQKLLETSTADAHARVHFLNTKAAQNGPHDAHCATDAKSSALQSGQNVWRHNHHHQIKP